MLISRHSILANSAASEDLREMARTPEWKRAWREKIGLLSIILVLMAGVGLLYVGRLLIVSMVTPLAMDPSSLMAIYDYNLSTFKHPAA